MKEPTRAEFRQELERLGEKEVRAHVIRGRRWGASYIDEARAWLAEKEHEARHRIQRWTIVGAVAACLAALLGAIALLK